jgi:hypothetical protein
VLLLVHRGGNLGPHSAPSESSARLRPVPATTTFLGAEFLIECVVVVFLSALLEFLRGIGSNASVVVVVLIALVSGVFLPLGCSLSGPEPMLCFMYCSCGCLYQLLFYLIAIRETRSSWQKNCAFYASSMPTCQASLD